MSLTQVLIMHDDPIILTMLGSMLSKLGHGIEEVRHDRAAVRRLERGGIDLIIAGIDPTDPEALELLSLSRRKYPDLPVVLLFPSSCSFRAAEARKMGALAVVDGPVCMNSLRDVIRLACERASAISGDGKKSGSKVARSNPLEVEMFPALAMLGDDSHFRRAVELATTVATAGAPVLIVGEQGTGKTSMARMIHRLSYRREQPLLDQLCDGLDHFGSVPEPLEGDDRPGNPGWLARANRGTLVLNEVDLLSNASQAKLLQVLVDREPRPVPPSVKPPVDVRFVFSTRENLSSLVTRGLFLPELHDRINVVCLKLPPLRQRGDDIGTLAGHFLARFAEASGRAVYGFTPAAMDSLLHHDWPGNVRELESVVQRGLNLARGSEVTLADLGWGSSRQRRGRSRSPAVTTQGRAEYALGTLREAMEAPEKRIILAALQASMGHRTDAARILKIDRTTLYTKLKKHGLLPKDEIA